MNNTNVLKKVWDYGWPEHKFLSIHLEREGKTSMIFSLCWETFCQSLTTRGTAWDRCLSWFVHCFLQHCAWAPGLPDKLASFPVWTTIQGFYMLLLQKSSSPAECCGCWQEIKHCGSDCSSEPTGQLSSLGSLLSWTTIYGPSAGVLVGLEGCSDIMGVINQRLKLSAYLEV